jgi:hypothetical protein
MTSRSLVRGALAFAGGIAAAIAVGVALHDRLPANVPPDPAPAPEPVERAVAPAAVRSPSPEQPLPPSATLELESADLPAAGPVRLTLGLAEPAAAADDELRQVRVVSQPDRRVLALEAALSPDRTAATIEIDGAWLLPGSYLVEFQTPERTPLPLRR